MTGLPWIYNLCDNRTRGTGCWLGAVCPSLRNWPTTSVMARRGRPWRNWRRWQAAGGPPWNALRRLKDRSAWISTRCGNGIAGTATLHWRCWPTCIYRWSGNKSWFQDTWEKRGSHRRNERLIPMTIPELRRLLSRLVGTKIIPTNLCFPGSVGDNGTEQDPAM